MTPTPHGIRFAGTTQDLRRWLSSLPPGLSLKQYAITMEHRRRPR